MKVLVVDSSLEVCKRIAEAICETLDVTIETAVVGSQGLAERHLEFRPDVVVVDVQLPEAAGLSLIRKMKAGGLSPIVIAISNVSTLPYRIHCHEAGAVYFFDKVRELEELCEAIADIREELGG